MSGAMNELERVPDEIEQVVRLAAINSGSTLPPEAELIPDLRWERKGAVEKALKERGYTLARLGRETGVNMGGVLVYGSLIAEVALADFLGLPVERLFPERYNPKSRSAKQRRYSLAQVKADLRLRRRPLQRLRMWLCRRLRCAAS